MNTYYKYVPNVYLAKCTEKHEKGDIIQLETKYGKINDSIVFNLIFERDSFYFYSIVRADGFNVYEADRFNMDYKLTEGEKNFALFCTLILAFGGLFMMFHWMFHVATD